MEQWQVIQEFPDYEVSDYGRVRSLETGRIKVPTKNQQGIPNVLFMRDFDQYRRSVAVLVATEFVPQPKFTFNTPLHLNGDRGDNTASNLVWRPRWFVLKYYNQFRPGYRPAVNEPIEDASTHRQFKNSLEAAIEFGLIDIEIFLAMSNRTVVFPTNQTFQYVNW